MSKQAEAVKNVRNRLRERGLDIPSRNNDGWVIFEHKAKQIGVDPSSGVWVRELEGEWHCMAMPCTVSGAIQAIEFLVQD